MDKSLFIVESPSKVKKIQKFLGNKFIVLASFGHIRDLDHKKLSIDVDNDFKPTYVVSKGKNKVITELKSKAKKCNTVWLACDYDREGESIAWHISKVLKLNKNNTRRAIFTEITKKALLNSVGNPKEIDMNMFYSQQARRILDRLIGYLISPILWKHFQSSYEKKMSLSAGRVQSVVVKLIKEREEEIDAFKGKNIFKISGVFDECINADLSKTFDKKDDVEEFMNHCKNAVFTIQKITVRKTNRKPSPPFITSSLQQEASIKLRFTPKKTMTVAQRLYENGLITYMRTDSLLLSNEANEMIKDVILNKWGEEYYKRRVYNKKVKGSQEAHEAIRPCKMELVNVYDTPNMSKDENRLYQLIWKRTVASQMSSVKVDIYTLKIEISDREELFIAKCENITFLGYLKAYGVKSKNNGMDKLDDEASDESESEKNMLDIFTSYKKGTIVEYNNIQAKENITKPPHSYFTEASLIKNLESIGVGRPSTYASMVSTVMDRQYVVKRNKKGEEVKLLTITLDDNKKLSKNTIKKTINATKNKLFITNIGKLVTNFLDEHFNNILNYNFTADIEKMLDDIASGKQKWNEVVRYFYEQFYPTVQELRSVSYNEKNKHKRLLGTHPDSGYDIICYIAKYGPVICIVHPTDKKKNKFVKLVDKDIDKVTYDEALKMLEFPRTIGKYENSDIILNKGRYGLYIKHSGKNYSVKDVDADTINEELAIEIIKNKAQNNVIKKINKDIIIKNGKYGPYINYKKKTNVKIWGKTKPEDLTLEQCMILINKKLKKK